MGVVISNLELGNDAEAEAALDKLITDFAGHPDCLMCSTDWQTNIRAAEDTNRPDSFTNTL